jgi:hypothetical protein
MEYPDFQVSEPSYEISSGGSFVNSSVSAELVWADSMICSNIVNPCTTASLEDSFSNTNDMSGNVTLNSKEGLISFNGFREEILSVDLYDISGKLIGHQKGDQPIVLNKISHGIVLVKLSFHDEIRVFKIPLIQ